VGLRPMYAKTSWELHPLVVVQSHQGKGIGKQLMAEIERRAKAQNVLNIFLGTDDETFRTNLSELDFQLEGLTEIIPKMRNLNQHPYEFYQKCGYQIVEIFPDANDIGKPDIWMWKRI
ncbi:MAG TPA: GNAT family N-acetyltransferase, partial [Bacillota bacterium]|nr:GNAT family N-acetyltransferase [Bacillota bacterium]